MDGHFHVSLQGNSGRIDKNIYESRRDKLQKIDRKLSKVTESLQKMSKLTVICPKWQKSVKFLSISVLYHILIWTSFVNSASVSL